MKTNVKINYKLQEQIIQMTNSLTVQNALVFCFFAKQRTSWSFRYFHSMVAKLEMPFSLKLPISLMCYEKFYKKQKKSQDVIDIKGAN